MPEKLYSILLKLYPEHFRRTYGDEALRLVRDRARDEKGFFPGLRLSLDLLIDLAMSLPREYRDARTMPIVAAQPVNCDPSFQLLGEGSLNPALLFLAGTLSAILLWACVTAVAHTRTFPALFPDSHSLQALVQSDLELARSPSENVLPGAHRFCMSPLSIPADVPAGNHQFALHLDKPAENTSISENDDLEICTSK